MHDAHTEVLVIGAGPTGLFLAGELARHGVRPRLIDQCPAPHTQTRATGVQPAALETLHRAEVAQKFLAEGTPVRGIRVLDEEMREAFAAAQPPEDTPFPFTCSIPQWRTEQILTERLDQLGVTVERGVTALDIEIASKGAVVTCKNGTGKPFRIHADYLVGAGGAHSPVRGALHERLDGITYPRRYLVADVAASGVPHDGDLLVMAISPVGMVMAARLPAGRTLVLTDLPDGEIPRDSPGLEDVRTALARHLKRPFPVADLRWASIYRTHRRMSPRFAEDRCFLAGDAAHLCSPLGGEGMNSGFLDGASLAWKLGAVLRRGGRPTLLDAYEPERQHVARQVLASSEAVHDFYFALVQMAAAGQRLGPPPRDPTRVVTSPSMLELTLGDSPILGFHGAALGAGRLRPGHRFPERTRLGGCRHHLLVYADAPPWDRAEFSARWANALVVLDGDGLCAAERAGVSPAGAVLVRPDGYVGFQAEVWNDDARAAFERLFGRQFIPATEPNSGNQAAS